MIPKRLFKAAILLGLGLNLASCGGFVADHWPHWAGGMPANFLDVGGGANAEQVTHAFEILLSDKNVKAVLINIFGGILRVDTLATGVVEAARKTHIQLPIVLRLEGTNVEAGREILKQSGLNFIVAETMKDAAEKVVAAARTA